MHPSGGALAGPGSLASAFAVDIPDEVLQSVSSVGEESYDDIFSDFADALLDTKSIDSVHSFISSHQHNSAPAAGGAPKPQVIARVAGTGLAPWEIHRPQKFVRDLVLRGRFSGRVLDAGCGIGDNALFIAKACPQAAVTAVDVVPRCLEFAAAKAKLRGMCGKVQMMAADLLEDDSAQQHAALASPAADGAYDCVLDSSTFHCFGDGDRQRYVAALGRLLSPGGRLFLNAMSEAEARPGGPRRITVPDLLSVFNRQSGWEVDLIEDSIIELHPTFWGGKALARLFTIRKL
ncbi:hypothetical protein HYH02_010115 [Chlamydomonas schloesseri]|uniref:Methyltransferase domain-containing protein n=1 Tax=Chlamydomonas schloesseri TaxID=2026947 RepID=A0A835TIX8_9CHLO|nr:hypothetical protein HYH02_010115 [Chlamydomonas schloesseri]|eukprot:KAG2441274.1 hypothetical protein HYH02_010115 [Chlamydomonas schloesseri]